MAHHKSALKRVRQTIKRTAQKRSQRADLRTVIKKFRLILDGENMDQAREAYSGVQKISIKLSLKESCTNVPARVISHALPFPWQKQQQAELNLRF